MKGFVKGLVFFLLVAGAIFGILRWRWMNFYRVPEDVHNMRNWANAPNLEPGDYVMTWKGDAHVGDLVRCVEPMDASKPPPSTPPRELIARVIALGGDIVSIQEGVVQINRHRATMKGCVQTPRKVVHLDKVEIELPCLNEETGSSLHDVLTIPAVVYPEFRVTVGKLFLLSDNRMGPWAYDSRVPTVGLVNADWCQERLSLRLWSRVGWSDSGRRMTWLP